LRLIGFPSDFPKLNFAIGIIRVRGGQTVFAVGKDYCELVSKDGGWDSAHAADSSHFCHRSKSWLALFCGATRLDTRLDHWLATYSDG
jgi:hypothetical protein